MPNLDVIKRVASTSTRNRAFRRRLPASLGSARFYASTEGGLKYLKAATSEVDRMLTRFAQDYVKHGQSVWDIGANVGLFSFAASGLTGKTGNVTCFEPDPWLASLLRRSADLNPNAGHVEVLCAAASDAKALSRFHIANQSRACNALAGFGNSIMGGVRNTMIVSTVTLDSTLSVARPPDVLKIDTEGAEALVLRGATHILAEVRPTILIEVNDDAKEEVGKILAANSYSLIDADTRRPITDPTYNTICLPR